MKPLESARWGWRIREIVRSFASSQFWWKRHVRIPKDNIHRFDGIGYRIVRKRADHFFRHGESSFNSAKIVLRSTDIINAVSLASLSERVVLKWISKHGVALIDGRIAFTGESSVCRIEFAIPLPNR